MSDLPVLTTWPGKPVDDDDKFIFVALRWSSCVFYRKGTDFLRRGEMMYGHGGSSHMGLSKMAARQWGEWLLGLRQGKEEGNEIGCRA